MGLSLAIGMLIDDAIVVRENIVRHLQRGKDHFDAARDGTAEIGLAVMATTFTILAVFVPGGLHGRHGRPDLLRVRHHGGRGGGGLPLRQLHPRPDALLALGGPRHRDGLPPALRRPDAAALQRVVRRPAPEVRAAARLVRCATGSAVLGVAAVAFLASFPILAILGGDFMPDFNRGEYQVSFKATPGATLAETKERALEVVRRLKADARRRLHLHDDRRGRHHAPAARPRASSTSS